MHRISATFLALGAWLVLGACALAQSNELAPSLEILREVGREGKGHRQATAAWSQLMTYADVDQLPTILAAMDDASPLAANWLRAAVDAIAERGVQNGGKLPTDALEAFLREKQHNPRARRLAYEWIARADPSAPDRLIPQMLDDPSIELRRDAVARVIAEAEAAAANEQTDAALAAFQKALVAARDLDQVKRVAEALAKLDQPVDLSHHFGFVEGWKLVGPFSNAQGIGFDTAYPPEEAVDLSAHYTGSAGPIQWISHHTDDEYGHVDLNKALGKHMGAVAYAAVEFQSARRQPAELRLGSTNAVKIWLNGKLLATAQAYHANNVMDQYIGRGELVPGGNLILLKICQNEQTEDWAQDWKYQFRVCDSLGKAILSVDRAPPKIARRQPTK
jgi:hypothetical protein